MKIEHVVSTMERTDCSFLENMQMQAPCLVVNQKCPESESTYSLPNGNAKILSTSEKGLSRSRNKLLQNATGDICIIGDDDVEYLPNYLQDIEQAYVSLPKADIIVFRFTHEKGKETRARYSKIKRLHMWNISKAASVEITFKRESILKAGISFHNEIGLGTEFPTGEENAFLADALRAGLKIYHYPKTICYAVEEHDLKNDNDIKRYLIGKGAAYHCIYKKVFWFYALGFIVLKKRSLFKSVSICQAYTWMKEGRKKYIEKTGEKR